ncbi:hypothetical protein GJV44_00174 [Candidatus Vallotia cooleyia]|nr:hypothetical protein GJV44_00174 [Candidatus Vallotia cooleyia]
MDFSNCVGSAFIFKNKYFILTELTPIKAVLKMCRIERIEGNALAGLNPTYSITTTVSDYVCAAPTNSLDSIM